MRRLAISLSIAGLAALGAVAAVSAADPTATPAPIVTPAPTPAPVVGGPATGTLAGILGLSQEEIAALRAGGQSLAQIAEDRDIDPDRLVDALVAQWAVRIDTRLAVGAITADEATALKADLAVRAKAMVNQEAVGGMRGAAVGAGPGAMGGQGQGQGMQGQRGQGMQGQGRNGTGAGTGVCPLTATPAPQS